MSEDDLLIKHIINKTYLKYKQNANDINFET